ncbi:MAG: helix-turn-helix domain-containing protein [Oscillospiraceae bacterium]
MCGALGISRATLHRCFVRVCATPPGAYLTKYRLDRAKEFLERGFSVKSTALSCGFSDSLYFSKVFKTSVGISPGKYKKNASTE